MMLTPCPPGCGCPLAGMPPDVKALLAEVSRAHTWTRTGVIGDDYQRGRAHALDDVDRVLLPILNGLTARAHRTPEPEPEPEPAPDAATVNDHMEAINTLVTEAIIASIAVRDLVPTLRDAALDRLHAAAIDVQEFSDPLLRASVTAALRERDRPEPDDSDAPDPETTVIEATTDPDAAYYRGTTAPGITNAAIATTPQAPDLTPAQAITAAVTAVLEDTTRQRDLIGRYPLLPHFDLDGPRRPPRPFFDLAWWLAATLPPGPETSAALRHLIEAADAAVRAAHPATGYVRREHP